jgi:MoaA/NifB/PqqE/SkfB family radical SAM enzyme
MQVSLPRSSLTPRDLLACWGQILTGRVPMISIEITRECPLSCPGCYAYGDSHLEGTTLCQLSDFRGDALVDGVLGLVKRHRPLHVSLVGGEPVVRHKELSRILPELNQMGVFTMVVTSAVIPIRKAWMDISRLRVAVSVDGLPEHHDVRRKPATYERILRNIKAAKLMCTGSSPNRCWNGGISGRVRRLLEPTAGSGPYLGKPVYAPDW